jgi:hypothetical protein
MKDVKIEIPMASVPIEKMFQTEIDDAGKNELCMGFCDIEIAHSILRTYDKKLRPPNLQQVNEFVDKAVANGGFATLDGKDSYHGFCQNHEKIAEAVGLAGYEKVFEKVDAGKIFALLQWGSVVEIRKEGSHSMLAVSWGKGEDGKFYCKVVDPWPYSDDCLLDTGRMVTLRKVGDQLIDSRNIGWMGWYRKKGTSWI